MRKIFIFTALLVFTAFNFNYALAEDNSQEQTTNSEQCIVKVADTQSLKDEIKNNKDIENLKKFIVNYENLQNKHSLTGLKQLYTEDFVNSDGYNKTQLFNLITQSFANYPDIKNAYEIEEIIVNDKFATIFLNQTVSATTKEPSKITNDNGEYSAKLKTVMYLERYNNKWKIYAEDVNYEFSMLAYGSAKGVEAKINAPQKVLANTDYCAGVSIKIPEGYNAIASINSTQLVDNFKQANESYRQVSLKNPSLERIIRANNAGNNEAVITSVGFTKQSTDIFKKPKIELSGLLILFQRVDIIPVNSNFKVQETK